MIWLQLFGVLFLGASGAYLWVDSTTYPLNPSRREVEWTLGLLAFIGGLSLAAYTANAG